MNGAAGNRYAPASAGLRLRVGLIALLALAVQAVGLAPQAATASELVPGGGAEMSLVFGSGKSRLVGSTALVPVKCLGSRTGLCNGVVTLAVGGHKHTAPFALRGGSAENLAVSIGRRHGLSGETAVATATTALATGGFSHVAGLLRFRG